MIRRLTFCSSITGVAVAGAGAYLWKLSQGPEVVWNRRGDWAPWDKVGFGARLGTMRSPLHSLLRSDMTKT